MQLNLVTKDDFNYITDLESTFFRFPFHMGHTDYMARIVFSYSSLTSFYV